MEPNNYRQGARPVDGTDPVDQGGGGPRGHHRPRQRPDHPARHQLRAL